PTSEAERTLRAVQPRTVLRAVEGPAEGRDGVAPRRRAASGGAEGAAELGAGDRPARPLQGGRGHRARRPVARGGGRQRRLPAQHAGAAERVEKESQPKQDDAGAARDRLLNRHYLRFESPFVAAAAATQRRPERGSAARNAARLLLAALRQRGA